MYVWDVWVESWGQREWRAIKGLLPAHSPLFAGPEMKMWERVHARACGGALSCLAHTRTGEGLT